MLIEKSRRHLVHFEVAGGTCHVTWRLHRAQALLEASERDIVFRILMQAPTFGCTWVAAVVMDDHVHALFIPGTMRTARQFVSSWKGASSRLISIHSARTAPLWQAEYYLRWMNSEREVATCAAYIHDNPRRRWPGIECYPWLLP